MKRQSMVIICLILLVSACQKSDTNNSNNRTTSSLSDTSQFARYTATSASGDVTVTIIQDTSSISDTEYFHIEVVHNLNDTLIIPGYDYDNQFLDIFTTVDYVTTPASVGSQGIILRGRSTADTMLWNPIQFVKPLSMTFKYFLIRPTSSTTQDTLVTINGI